METKAVKKRGKRLKRLFKLKERESDDDGYNNYPVQEEPLKESNLVTKKQSKAEEISNDSASSHNENSAPNEISRRKRLDKLANKKHNENVVTTELELEDTKKKLLRKHISKPKNHASDSDDEFEEAGSLYGDEESDYVWSEDDNDSEHGKKGKKSKRYSKGVDATKSRNKFYKDEIYQDDDYGKKEIRSNLIEGKLEFDEIQLKEPKSLKFYDKIFNKIENVQDLCKETTRKLDVRSMLKQAKEELKDSKPLEPLILPEMKLSDDEGDLEVLGVDQPKESKPILKNEEREDSNFPVTIYKNNAWKNREIYLNSLKPKKAKLNEIIVVATELDKKPEIKEWDQDEGEDQEEENSEDEQVEERKTCPICLCFIKYEENTTEDEPGEGICGCNGEGEENPNAIDIDMIRQLEGDYEEAEEEQADEQQSEGEGEGEEGNKENNDDEKDINNESEHYSDEEPDEEEKKKIKEKEDNLKRQQLKEAQQNIRNRMKIAKYFDEEAELSSDHEDSDYENILDKHLQLHNQDLQGLIDNGKIDENAENFYEKYLKDNIDLDRQQTIDVIKAITSKSRRNNNESYLADGAADDDLSLWARMRNQRSSQSFADIKNRILKVYKENGMENELNEVEQKQIIEQAMLKKLRQMTKSAQNYREKTQSDFFEVKDYDNIIDDRSKTNIAPVAKKPQKRVIYNSLFNSK